MRMCCVFEIPINKWYQTCSVFNFKEKEKANVCLELNAAAESIYISNEQEGFIPIPRPNLVWYLNAQA